MKVALFSDLHLDVYAGKRSVSLEEAMDACARGLENLDFDVVVLAGDLSNDCRTTVRIAAGIEERIRRKVFYVPGNHDLYDLENHWKTSEILRYLEGDERCLMGRKVAFETWDLVGDVGWYDYSYGSSNYREEQFAKKNHEGKIWRDGYLIDWGKSDIEVSRAMNDHLFSLIDDHRRDKTLVVTHMINHPNFKVTLPGPSQWDFFNAFLGSRDLFAHFAQKPVRAALCGHIHYRFDFVLQGMTYACRCLGREDEWPSISRGVPLELSDQAKDACLILEF